MSYLQLTRAIVINPTVSLVICFIIVIFFLKYLEITLIFSHHSAISIYLSGFKPMQVTTKVT